MDENEKEHINLNLMVEATINAKLNVIPEPACSSNDPRNSFDSILCMAMVLSLEPVRMRPFGYSSRV